MWVVDLNYIFECDWLIKLSDNNKLSNNKLYKNKLSDNNLASELVENRAFLNQSQQFVIFMIKLIFMIKQENGFVVTVIILESLSRDVSQFCYFAWFLLIH